MILVGLIWWIKSASGFMSFNFIIAIENGLHLVEVPCEYCFSTFPFCFSITPWNQHKRTCHGRWLYYTKNYRKAQSRVTPRPNISKGNHPFQALQRPHEKSSFSFKTSKAIHYSIPLYICFFCLHQILRNILWKNLALFCVYNWIHIMHVYVRIE